MNDQGNYIGKRKPRPAVAALTPQERFRHLQGLYTSPGQVNPPSRRELPKTAIRRAVAKGGSIEAIATMFGVDKAVIGRIASPGISRRKVAA